MSTLTAFHPLIRAWFSERFGAPTEIQNRAWPLIAEGRHVLVTAPTGTGKTLTAFLWSLNQLLSGAWPTGVCSVLYISPLKALNTDVRRNLLSPLEELTCRARNEGVPFPEIRVLTRSGDTPTSERRKMIRNPPEILITTPESLNLLLCSQNSRAGLTSLRTVILDEIHAVVATKRGTHLITAVDRLVPLSGEFQRIALSATVRPIPTVAAFVGGFTMEDPDAPETRRPREVIPVQSREQKHYELRIRFPKSKEADSAREEFRSTLIEDIRGLTEENRTTLIFTNSRRMCEKISLNLNAGYDQPVAYAHHGSLSREIRTEVEQRLKAGKLKAIVATASLEMGIDIGELDEVVLVQTPFSLSSAAQRIGRAGHRVGVKSRATFFPVTPIDILHAAACAEAVRERDIEPICPITSPLDVLAQIIVAMVGVRTWNLDSLFSLVRTSYPYRELVREHFDLVVSMLAGRYGGTNIRELAPKVTVDALDKTVRARPGALHAVRMSGGTIPDRGYYRMRDAKNNNLIGELDEEFVWEAKVGQLFTLGNQNWRIENITHNDVLVTPGDRNGRATPFWKAEGVGRDFHFSRRISETAKIVDSLLDDEHAVERISTRLNVSSNAAESLIEFVQLQKEITDGPFPGHEHIVVEHVRSAPGGAPGTQCVIHNFWGGRLNKAYALALDAAWERRYHARAEVFAGDDCVAVLLPDDIDANELLALVMPATLEELLRERLEGSGLFGAQFRECSQRALLLEKTGFDRRTPLWISRLRSQKLLSSVGRYDDFPIRLEAWRSCLQDLFDLTNLREMLEKVQDGRTRVTQVYTATPSPLARTVTFEQVNTYMYMTDTPQTTGETPVRKTLIKELLHNPEIRPTVPAEVVHEFEQKRLRLAPGYAPSTPEDFLDWIGDRVLVSLEEMTTMESAMMRDAELRLSDILKVVAEKLVALHDAEGNRRMFALRERAPFLAKSLYPPTVFTYHDPVLGTVLEVCAIPEDEEDERETFAQWFSSYGPRPIASVARAAAISVEKVNEWIRELAEEEKVVTGPLITDHAEEHVCDAETYEILLRMTRSRRRMSIEPLGSEHLQPFLAEKAGVGDDGEGVYEVLGHLEALLYYPAPAGLWESDILPARLKRYDPSWLDTVFLEQGVSWVGTGRRRIAFYYSSERDLLDEKDALGASGPNENATETRATGEDGILPSRMGNFDFEQLLRHTSIHADELASLLWDAAWEGRISNDTFAAVRKGVHTSFRSTPPPDHRFTSTGRRRGRIGYRQKRTIIAPGRWYYVPQNEADRGILETEERRKDRVRVLLDRYGVLFRSLLKRELPAFQWSSVFRALRIMELSGEVVAGMFFRGVAGLQFASPDGISRLHKTKEGTDRVYWINAADPSSICGLDLTDLPFDLPPRSDRTHLVFKGSRPVLISRRLGKNLTFFTTPDHPGIEEYPGFLHHLSAGPSATMRKIAVEKINDQNAGDSPYLEVLRRQFELSIEPNRVVLFPRMDSY